MLKRRFRRKTDSGANPFDMKWLLLKTAVSSLYYLEVNDSCKDPVMNILIHLHPQAFPSGLLYHLTKHVISKNYFLNV